jgi:hypothetical protein
MAHFIRAYKYVYLPHVPAKFIVTITQKNYFLFSTSLLRRPMMTQCITAAVLFGAGDVIAQQAVEGKGRKHDVSGVFSVYGFRVLQARGHLFYIHIKAREFSFFFLLTLFFFLLSLRELCDLHSTEVRGSPYFFFLSQLQGFSIVFTSKTDYFVFKVLFLDQL